ncbi:aminobenzoyl-glutamate utilization protein B [Byssothecium circinans]|uniref:Peptidase M20 domain-containing protein 2 n=1 Tax=Byssothecium circinans TaxID=147558 RepID=A0A6A5TJQ3_9PLEO|nr:aminobenzoyl-glutamate utilization protein B [Byssothecium circinans]
MAKSTAFVIALMATAINPTLARSILPRQGNNTAYIDVISEYVDSRYDDLWNISQTLHENPELGFKEVKAHELLASFMEAQEGWTVTRSLYNISTAFSAVFEGNGDGPIVSFNSEYDALPNLGHACGHNLIATVGVTGALATAKIMTEQKLAGKVVLFGTPGEESLGGKVDMLEAGIFDDYKIDISLIAHPSNAPDSPYMNTFSTSRLDLEYYGKESHASAAPYQGINAQDALALAYQGIGLLRQQSQATDQVHGIITSGGTSINVIPALSTASFQIRAKDDADLESWTSRVLNCFDAGALATGAELNLTMRENSYSAMLSNDILATAWSKYFVTLNGTVPDQKLDKIKAPSGSTDQGNISLKFPSIQPLFQIYNENGSVPTGGPHTKPFEAAAKSKPAFEKAMMTAKGLAGVAVDMLTVEGMLEAVKEEFEGTVAEKRKRGIKRDITKVRNELGGVHFH